jgi:hypothetical protein
MSQPPSPERFLVKPTRPQKLFVECPQGAVLPRPGPALLWDSSSPPSVPALTWNGVRGIGEQKREAASPTFLSDALHPATPTVRRWIVFLLVGTIVVIPLITGLASGSFLLAVVVGTVWMSISTVILGLWASHRNIGHLSSGPVATTSLPNGWMLPTGVEIRSDVSADAAKAIDHRRLLAASVALAVSCLSLGVLIAWGHIAKHMASGYLMVILSLTILVDLMILLFTLRSVHGGTPRPSIDRPSFVSIAVMGIPLFTMVLVTSVGFRGFIWVQADGTSLTLLWLALGANIWWTVEMARRWNLSYEVKKF